MSDEFDVIHLEQEDVQEIIDWAVATAAMVILMDNAPEHENVEQGIERLGGYIKAHSMIFENMPDVIIHPATVIAQESAAEALEEEEQVEEFLKEIEGL